MRYYTFGGVVVAEANGSSLYWAEANLQGTLTAVVSAFSESSPATYRTVTPYGTVVTGSGGGTWPDARTFLNDFTDPATGLVDVAARKFDPSLGLFISVDPILNPAQPQSMTGYFYGADDPVNNADPSGELISGANGCQGSTCYHTTPQNTQPSGSNGSGNGGGAGSGCDSYIQQCSTIPGSGSTYHPPTVIAGPGVGLPPMSPFSADPEPLQIGDILNDPSLLTGLTPEAVLIRLGWTGGVPSGWTVTRLGKGGHVGLGFVRRQQFETPRGRIGNTGTMLRWYPGNGRYALPNWKVSLHDSGRDIGPDGQGHPTPQSAYWNQPGTPEEIFDPMNGGGGSASNSGEGPTPNSGNDDSGSGTDDTGPCACGGTDPEPFGSDDDPLDFGLF